MKNDREYRDMQLRAVANEEYKVEGYASTFEPYVLFSMDDIDYKEQIMPTAFDECDMTDCVFRVDHEGMREHLQGLSKPILTSMGLRLLQI